MSVKHNSRESIVETASRLFFTQGYHATGLSQIIKESHCPKGSLYYYFPQGKEELALECIERTRIIVLGKWKDTFEKIDDPSQAISSFTRTVAEDAEACNFEGFMPFSFWMAAETAAISDNMRSVCKGVLDDWQGIISERLQQKGMEDNKAIETASVVISLIEGAFILSLTQRDKLPLIRASQYVSLLINFE